MPTPKSETLRDAWAIQRLHPEAAVRAANQPSRLADHHAQEVVAVGHIELDAIDARAHRPVRGGRRQRHRVRAAASDLILGSTHTSRLPVRAAAYTSEIITGMTEVYSRAPSQAQVSGTMELLPGGGLTTIVAAESAGTPFEHVMVAGATP